MIKQTSDHTYVLTLTVRNQPGVLVRCAQVFNRRGHNIEALEVTPDPRNHDQSHMHISAFGAFDTMQQIIAQLHKLIDVISINEKEMP